MARYRNNSLCSGIQLCSNSASYLRIQNKKTSRSKTNSSNQFNWNGNTSNNIHNSQSKILSNNVFYRKRTLGNNLYSNNNIQKTIIQNNHKVFQESRFMNLSHLILEKFLAILRDKITNTSIINNFDLRITLQHVHNLTL